MCLAGMCPKELLGPNQLLEMDFWKVGLHKVTVTEGSSMECQGSG